MNDDDRRRLSDERVADGWRNSYAAVERLSRVADREEYRASIDAMVQAWQELSWNLDQLHRSIKRDSDAIRDEMRQGFAETWALLK